MAEFSGIPGQEMPFSLEAEQSVLGAILVDSACLAVVLDTLRPDNFYRDEHAKVFDIMLRLFTAAAPVDFVTVLEQTCREEVFPSDAEAKIYLTQLSALVPSTRNVGAYAEIVREKSQLRALIQTAQDIIENSRSSGESPQTLIDIAEQRIFEIRADRHGSKLVKIDGIMLDVYDRLQRLSGEDRDQYLGLPTGFPSLDRIMTGLNKSDFILLAARPGVGKTSFALNIASNVAMKTGKKVAIFSLEMSREQLVERMLSSDALVVGSKMRTGELTAQEWIRLANSAKELSRAPILVDDTASITVPEMKARLRRERDIGMVIIDYLQLMSSSSRSDNRVQIVSEITRSLKVMAKEMNVPLLVLSQLSRDIEKRAGHRPMLSDLRESGSIEQDADIVLFLSRDTDLDPENGSPNLMKCIVAKNRHGEVGDIDLVWDGEHTRFTVMEKFRDE